MKMESNNLVYDDLDLRCRLTIIGGIAYLELLDLGAEHARYKVPEVKRYCGEWSWDNPVGSLQQIILYGNKWRYLPKV